MHIKTFNLLLIGLVILTACKHDPFPGPPSGMGNDTIQNPTDTTPVSQCDPDTVYFAKDILPILTANCATSGCHDAATASEGVILTSYTSVINTADVKPFDPNAGKLYEKITTSKSEDRMPPPPNNPLTAEQIAAIRKWIEQGAQNLSCDECDTSNLSFSADIQPVFNQSCVSCHGSSNPSGGRSLLTYADITDAILNANLQQRINHQGNFAYMPPSGIKLDNCKLSKIRLWIDAGMPNN